MDCPFCEILVNRTRIIEEKIYCFIILSNPRLMPSHTLVIPKRHIEKVSDMTKDEKNELFDALLEYQEKILNNIASGCDIRQHYRPFMPQSKVKVNHIHFHLHPREFEDVLFEKSQRYEHEMWEELSEEEREKYTYLFRKQ